MIERKVIVANRAGIHARPASILVQATKNFQCNIFFEKGSDKINAKSIMGIITLGAAYGTEINIITDGEDEQAAIDTLTRLFETKFEEE